MKREIVKSDIDCLFVCLVVQRALRACFSASPLKTLHLLQLLMTPMGHGHYGRCQVPRTVNIFFHCPALCTESKRSPTLATLFCKLVGILKKHGS